MSKYIILYNKDRGTWSIYDNSTGDEVVAYYKYEAAVRWVEEHNVYKGE